MTLNPEDWSFEKQMKNDPRFVRLEQIQAIMWAFIPQSAYSKGIRESIENFYSGEFIVSNKIENYHKLIKNIEKTISMSDFSGVPIKEIC